MKKDRTELLKKRSQKSKRSDIKYFLTIYFLTKTTKNCANAVGSLLVLHFLILFLLIFKICTVQWINCTNMKDELNCIYNGGGEVNLLQSELSISSLQHKEYYMEWEKLKKWHVCWNRRSKYPRLDLDSGYTGNRHPCYFSHIGDISILISLSKWSITPNARMRQPY